MSFRKTCCDVTMTAPVYRSHLEAGHKIFRCVICQRIVDRRVPGCYEPNVCSPACRDEAVSRGHCFSCCVPLDSEEDEGQCPGCRHDSAVQFQASRHCEEEGRKVQGILVSLHRAEWTPDVYHGTPVREALQRYYAALRQPA